MPRQHPQVSATVPTKLRAACLALPDAYEEQAWVGTRWMVRKKTFAHVLMVAEGWPPVYARAAGRDGCVLTFQSWLPRADPHAFADPPYFRPPWRPDIVGRILEGRIDWDEIAQLVTASYCTLVPKKQAELVMQSKTGRVAPARS